MNENLKSQIWKIANDVREAVDSWDFRQYILCTLFFRFLSEDFVRYFNEHYELAIPYGKLTYDDMTDEIIDEVVKEKGYFLPSGRIFSELLKEVDTNHDLSDTLRLTFFSIQSSAEGYPSELNIKGIFDSFDTSSHRLGNTIEERNKRLADILKGIASIQFEPKSDFFGDAYEFIISNYAKNAGKSGGEFFTPPHVAKLIAQLAMHNLNTAENCKIYDPACGSGSLLLQAQKLNPAAAEHLRFFGQELNHTTYNLARMNMFAHNVHYSKFNIELGDTLIDPRFADEKPFNAIVANPPFSIRWAGASNPKLLEDPRYAPAGILAPKSKADFAFILHAYNYLSEKGRAAIVIPPGVLFRSGAEYLIRKHLIINNAIESVILLAPNLFYSTAIPIAILVLNKNKPNTDIQFINAEGQDFFKKEGSKNILQDEHIKRIMHIFTRKENIERTSISTPYSEIVDQDYSLQINRYIATHPP